MFNFPNNNEENVADDVDLSKVAVYDGCRKAIQTYFPDVMFVKCHTGQKIKLGSMTIDVLTTMEDAVSATTGKNTLTEGNSMSSVLRFTFADGTRFITLGDFTEERQAHLLKMYGDDEFRCDVTDVAHHGFNRVTNLYSKIKANYALWTNYPNDNFYTGNSAGSWHKTQTTKVKKDLTSANSNVNIYYGDVTNLCSDGYAAGIGGEIISSAFTEIVGNVNYGVCTASDGTALPVMGYCSKKVGSGMLNYCDGSTRNDAGTNTPDVTVITTANETAAAGVAINGEYDDTVFMINTESGQLVPAWTHAAGLTDSVATPTVTESEQDTEQPNEGETTVSPVEDDTNVPHSENDTTIPYGENDTTAPYGENDTISSDQENDTTTVVLPTPNPVVMPAESVG